jgi:hypothetical protein
MMAFKHLAEMQRLDWETMRANIAAALAVADQISLPDLLAEHRATGGALEVLGYIQIAHDDGHRVDKDELEIVEIQSDAENETSRPFEVPKVVFLSERLRLLRESLA